MFVITALILWSPVLAQAVSPGLLSGVMFTGRITAAPPRQATPSGFTIGPGIRVHLWGGAHVAADFLLHRTEIATSTQQSGRTRVSEWALPVTLAYRFRSPARPFVRTGISFNRVFHITGAVKCARGPFGEQFYCADGSPIAEVRHAGTLGPVLGGGFRFRFSRVSLEPEVRWTRWIDRNIGVRDSDVRSNLNQVELLVGLFF
jgi:hypothetical protein